MNTINLFTKDIKGEIVGLFIGALFFIIGATVIGLLVNNLVMFSLFSLIGSMALLFPYYFVYNKICFNEKEIIITNIFSNKSIKYSEVIYISEVRGSFLKLKAKRNYYLLGYKSMGMNIDSENRTINIINQEIKNITGVYVKCRYLQGVSIIEK